MQNEFYYLNELELIMDNFIETNSQDGTFGWISDTTAKRMAQAAFAVIQTNKEVSDFVEAQNKTS